MRPDPSEALWQDLRRTVRHDLRSPLAVIVTQCDLMDEGMGGPVAVERIRRQARRMLEQLDALALRFDERP